MSAFPPPTQFAPHTEQWTRRPALARLHPKLNPAQQQEAIARLAGWPRLIHHLALAGAL